MSIFNRISCFEFFKTEQTSFRLQVVKINGKAFVGCGKFYLNCKSQNWEPTKKQVFIPRAAWDSFQLYAEHVTASLAANPGMHIIFI